MSDEGTTTDIKPRDIADLIEALEEVHANLEDDDQAFIALSAITMLRRCARDLRGGEGA